MTTTTNRLPKAFDDLQPWTAWALPTETQRYDKRAQSSLEEVAAFCTALQPRMQALILYLSNFKWGTPLAPDDETLYRLGLGYMEATIPIDLGWKTPLAKDSFDPKRMYFPQRL